LPPTYVNSRDAEYPCPSGKNKKSRKLIIIEFPTLIIPKYFIDVGVSHLKKQYYFGIISRNEKYSKFLYAANSFWAR